MLKTCSSFSTMLFNILVQLTSNYAILNPFTSHMLNNMVEEVDKIVYFLHFKFLINSWPNWTKKEEVIAAKSDQRKEGAGRSTKRRNTSKVSFQADVAHTCTHNYLNLIPSNPPCGTPRVLTCGKITKLTKQTECVFCLFVPLLLLFSGFLPHFHIHPITYYWLLCLTIFVLQSP